MPQHLLLLRGINVGGKNRVPMAELRDLLAELGFTDVRTLIASGNVVARHRKGAAAVGELVERELPARFALDSSLVKVLVLSPEQLRRVVEERPPGFGDEPERYHSDAIFLIDISPAEALAVFSPREGVDAIWPGPGVIYSQRLSAERTKSRLGRIVGTAPYQSMTIRSWSTTLKLLAMLDEK